MGSFMLGLGSMLFLGQAMDSAKSADNLKKPQCGIEVDVSR
jgi:hypothetical protein